VSPLYGLAHSIDVSLNSLFYCSSIRRIEAPYPTLIMLDKNHVRPRAATFPD